MATTIWPSPVQDASTTSISAYRDLVHRVPRSWRAHENLANALAQAGRLHEAVEPYERAITMLEALASPADHAETLANLQHKLRVVRAATP